PPTPLNTLSLHDALPIWLRRRDGTRRFPRERGVLAEVAHRPRWQGHAIGEDAGQPHAVSDRRARSVGHALLRDRRRLDRHAARADRKSTRLNSSHGSISY